MKKKLFTLIALLLSVIVIYGGSGVNTYIFCCDDCRDEGTAAIIEHKCCEIHHHHHLGGLIEHQEEHVCDQNLSESHGECGFERVSVSWILSVEKNLHLQPAVLDLVELISYSDIYNHPEYDDIESSFFEKTSQKPPNLSKNVYFSLLTTLII